MAYNAVPPVTIYLHFYRAVQFTRAHARALSASETRRNRTWRSERAEESCRLHEVVSIFVHTICEWFVHAYSGRLCACACTEMYRVFVFSLFRIFRTSGRREWYKRRKPEGGNVSGRKKDNLYCFLKCTLLEQNGRKVGIKGYCLMDCCVLFR